MLEKGFFHTAMAVFYALRKTKIKLHFSSYHHLILFRHTPLSTKVSEAGGGSLGKMEKVLGDRIDQIVGFQWSRQMGKRYG